MTQENRPVYGSVFKNSMSVSDYSAATTSNLRSAKTPL